VGEDLILADRLPEMVQGHAQASLSAEVRLLVDEGDPLDGDQVFDRHRHPVQRAAQPSGANVGVAIARCTPGAISQHRDVRGDVLVYSVDALKVSLNDVLGA
jgi:hypothetical protein